MILLCTVIPDGHAGIPTFIPLCVIVHVASHDVTTQIRRSFAYMLSIDLPTYEHAATVVFNFDLD